MDSQDHRALLGLSGEANDWRERESEDSFSSGDSNDDWWKESSCSTCSDSDSDGWPTAWQEDVASKGELFYVECGSQNVSTNKWGPKSSVENKEQPSTSRRSSRNWREGAQGTLMRLLRRQSHQKRSSKKNIGIQGIPSESSGDISRNVQLFQGTVERTANKVTFHDNQRGETRTVRLLVEPRKHNLGRRATLCEALLGLVPGHFSLEPPDDQRIMVAGFIPDTEATQMPTIKIGDWLHSIDGQEVTYKNINNILSSITSPCRVTLTLQRVAGCDVTQHTPPHLISKGMEVEQLLQLVCRGAASKGGGSLVLLSTVTNQEEVEGGVEDRDEILYCYPASRQPALVATRGLFLTLNQLVQELAPSSPLLSSFVLGGELTHVMYWRDGLGLVLLSVPGSSSSVLAAQTLFSQFIKAIEFSYQSFTRAAMEQKARLDLLVDSFFSHYFKLNHEPSHKGFLPAAHFLPLPLERQTELDSALSELEAADFGEEFDTHPGCHRPFMILGSCLFYKGLTLCSHLPAGILEEFHVFCWVHGLSTLGTTGPPLRRLLTWKEVYPPPPPYFPDETYPITQGRSFALLLGQNHHILAVLLESTPYMLREEEAPGPNILYVEKAQATLDLIHRLGISEITEKLLEKKFRPMVAETILPVKKKQRNSKTDQLMRSLRLNSGKHTGALSKAHSSGSLSVSSISRKSQKVTSILKHKNSPRTSDHSEDTCSQSASEEMRRLEYSDSSSEDSWDPCQKSNDHINCSLDLPDSRLSLLDTIFPMRLVEGAANALFHYVLLEPGMGIFLAPDVGNKQEMGSILASFHKNSLAIHKMLQHNEVNSNQGLIPVHELGLMFESSEHANPNGHPVVYWVVGRIFNDSNARELFVCYQDTITINLVEFAFRLALAISG